MHVAPHRNRPCQPTLAKTFDSLVALTMERFNGPPKSVYQKGFSADFCEQNSFSESKSPPWSAWAEHQGASPRVFTCAFGAAERAGNTLYGARSSRTSCSRQGRSDAFSQRLNLFKGETCSSEGRLGVRAQSRFGRNVKWGAALPQPGCSRRWLESENVQDQGARE